MNRIDATIEHRVVTTGYGIANSVKVGWVCIGCDALLVQGVDKPNSYPLLAIRCTGILFHH